VTEWVASLLVKALTTYLMAGAVVGTLFAFLGSGRVDPAAREGTTGFRLMIVPGSILLWPLVLARWTRGSGPPEERTSHRALAREDRNR